MRIAPVALAFTACWTGDPSPVAPVANAPAPPALRVGRRFEISMHTTACMGMCPEYEIHIYGDGRVTWHGIAVVDTLGDQVGRIDAAKVRELERAVDVASFFELDDAGNPPVMTRYVVCTDTSHAIVTVKRAERAHVVDDAGCTHTSLTDLEILVEKVAAPWIGKYASPP